MRKVFLENLPMKNGFGKNKGKQVIDWVRSIMCKVRFIYDDIEGEILISEYDKSAHCLIIFYNNKPFSIYTSDFRMARLGTVVGKIIRDFEINIGDVIKDEKRNLTIIDIETRQEKNGKKQKYYKYKCNECGFEDWKSRMTLVSCKTGCLACCNSPQVIVPHINSIVANPETHWMIKYFQGGYDEAKLYTPCSNKTIFPICPDCGTVKNKEVIINNIYKTHSIGCTCGDGFSYGHKYMHNLLKQLNLEFIDNKSFDWCSFPDYKDRSKISKGEYDFVIEELKLIVEIDGGWHRKDNKISGQTKKHSKYLDDMKDLLAEQNDYKVVRISDEDSIKDNILKSKLVNILNLNNVDWLICEEFALKNIVKEVCNIKKNNPNITTTDISKITNISCSPIKSYLRKGSKLGWCDYNGKQERIKAVSKNGKSNGKKLEIFKDGISLGIFESCSELARRSYELFEIELDKNKISMVCNGKRPHHKGFIFKYVEKSNNNQDTTKSA